MASASQRMRNPAISVILPFYNSEQTLGRSVQSILDQTFRNFELILINNNSSDGSLDIASAFAQADKRITLIETSRQGVVFAANEGMKEARGKYITRMDADDAAYTDRLTRQIEYLEQKSAIAICATQVDHKTDQPNDFQCFVDWSNSLNSWQEIYSNRFVEFPLVNPTLMFRRSVLKDIGYLKEGDFPEDYEWFLRAVDQGHKAGKIPTPLLTWNDSSTRLTRSDQRYRTEAFFNIKTYYLARHLREIHQTQVWIWGAGKLSFKRSQLLLQYGIGIAGYIDIKKGKKLKDYHCIHFNDIDQSQQPFILSYVTNRGQRDEVRKFLNDRNYTEDKHYIIAG